MQEHLRPVAPGDESTETPRTRHRAPQRPRPNKPLPSDRMKFDTAQLALKAIVLDSNNGTKSVGAQEMSKRLALSAATAGLNNAFFTEAGFIVREGKGRWKPTAIATEFARTHSFDAARAGQSLTESLRRSWYFREVRQQLAMGPTTVSQMIEVLAHAAGATADHRPQLRLVLDWLEYARLIDTKSGTVTLTGAADQQTPSADLSDPADPASQRPTTESPQRGAVDTIDEVGKPELAESRPEVARTADEARRPPERRGVPVLAFSFDFSLSAADLAVLSPDQIRAVYEAVGRVAAIKAGIET